MIVLSFHRFYALTRLKTLESKVLQQFSKINWSIDFGTPKELQRNSKGTPKELQGNSKGTPKDLQRIHKSIYSKQLQKLQAAIASGHNDVDVESWTLISKGSTLYYVCITGRAVRCPPTMPFYLCPIFWIPTRGIYIEEAKSGRYVVVMRFHIIEKLSQKLWLCHDTDDLDISNFTSSDLGRKIYYSFLYIGMQCNFNLQ